MITAIDSNILLDILAPNPDFYEASVREMERAANAGSMIICDMVYAELCIHFATQHECDEFLQSIEIRVEPLRREALLLASRAYRTYRQRGGQRDRILADFLIGAHAQVQATRLLSRDRGFYRRLFPKLTLVDPAAP
jgi:predicted nucleic acid-binding protein